MEWKTVIYVPFGDISNRHIFLSCVLCYESYVNRIFKNCLNSLMEKKNCLISDSVYLNSFQLTD